MFLMIRWRVWEGSSRLGRILLASELSRFVAAKFKVRACGLLLTGALKTWLQPRHLPDAYSLAFCRIQIPNLLLEMFDLNCTPMRADHATQKVSHHPGSLWWIILSPVIANYADWLWVSFDFWKRTPQNLKLLILPIEFSKVVASKWPSKVLLKGKFLSLLLQSDDHFVAPVLINYVDWLYRPLTTTPNSKALLTFSLGKC